MGPWKLEDFEEEVARWRDREHAPDAIVAQTLAWVLEELGHNPYQPAAGPPGGPFPVTWWFAKLPVWTDNNDRVVCLYEINTVERALTCHLVSQLPAGSL